MNAPTSTLLQGYDYSTALFVCSDIRTRKQRRTKQSFTQHKEVSHIPLLQQGVLPVGYYRPPLQYFKGSIFKSNSVIRQELKVSGDSRIIY
jgi:hypothetical protein